VPVEAAKPPEVPITRECSEFVEMVDHTVNYDWTTAGMLLGQKTHAYLSEEQRNLLYSEPSVLARLQQQQQQGPSEPSFPLSGWGERNVISPRVSWARIRLREQRMELAEQESATAADGRLPSSPPKITTVATTSQGAAAGPSSTPAANKYTVWLHEEKAEEDQTLAVLSEGVQISHVSVGKGTALRTPASKH
jgi:hypothetical protein